MSEIKKESKPEYFDCELCENYRPRKATRKEKLSRVIMIWFAAFGLTGGTLFLIALYSGVIFEAVGL